MAKFLRVLIAFTAVAGILACGVLSPSTPAPTSAATQLLGGSPIPTLPDTSTAPVQGLTVSFNNVNLVVPSGLATGTTNSSTTDVEFPYVNPSAGEMPLHVKIILNGYPLQGTILEPQITVFKAAAYAQYGGLTQQVISALQGPQYAAGQPLPQGFPAGQFNAHAQALGFANGHGVRYLTQFDQAPLPVNNNELIYYFHGLTNDSSNYVQVILPLQAPFLASDANPASPLPADGVPFNMDQLQSYFIAVAQKLNVTTPEQFTPALTALDALIQTISAQ